MSRPKWAASTSTNVEEWEILVIEYLRAFTDESRCFIFTPVLSSDASDHVDGPTGTEGAPLEEAGENLGGREQRSGKDGGDDAMLTTEVGTKRKMGEKQKAIQKRYRERKKERMHELQERCASPKDKKENARASSHTTLASGYSDHSFLLGTAEHHKERETDPVSIKLGAFISQKAIHFVFIFFFQG